MLSFFWQHALADIYQKRSDERNEPQIPDLKHTKRQRTYDQTIPLNSPIFAPLKQSTLPNEPQLCQANCRESNGFFDVQNQTNCCYNKSPIRLIDAFPSS